MLAAALKSIAKIAWHKALVLASQLQRVGSFFGAKETRPAAVLNRISYILVVRREKRELSDLTSNVYGYISQNTKDVIDD